MGGNGFNLLDLLKGFQGLAQIKLGPGVVGNTSTMGIATIAGGTIIATALALAGAADAAVTLLGMVFGFGFLICLGNWIFAYRRPNESLLGGTQLLALRRAQMAAKGIGEAPSAPPVEAPNPPLIEGHVDGQ